MIDWCLTPTLAVFQLYHGMNKLITIFLIKAFITSGMSVNIDQQNV